MRSEQQEAVLRRRASLFIFATMTLALVYLLGRVDFGGGETRVPPVVKRNVEAAHRIVLELPAGEWIEQVPPDTLAVRLRSAGVLWILVRLPLWTPTTRRTEYSSIEWMKLAERVQALREGGLRIILAPQYWDGSTLTSRPTGNLTGTFFSTYRTMTEEVASFAADCHADALLLDGVFGDPGVSVSEWLDLLASLRASFPGMIEARMDEGYTPPMYLTHLDGAYIANDTLRFNAISATLPARQRDVPIYLAMADPDGYASGNEPWKVILRSTNPDLTSAVALITTAQARGIVLSGRATAEALLQPDAGNADLIAGLRALREQRLLEDLGKARQKISAF